jgi:Tfp pilus assembly protein PilN
MRPINLIPEGERRRNGGAGRTGPLAFIVLGALLVALLGVVMLETTSNQVSERESELTSVQARTVALKERADRLAPFASFHEVKEQRTTTVRELADNRFNWSRVLHELSLVMPRWVILTKITGSSGQSVAEETSGIGSSIAGPTLTVTGCGKTQTRVAQMVSALKQIDGVTRVGLEKSVLRFPTENSGGEGGSSGEEKCPPRTFAFVAAAAFDGAPLPVEATEGAEEPEASSEPESAEPAEGEAATSEAESSTETSSTGATTTTTTESVPPEG